MPPIRVDYAKSARSRCNLKECSKLIEKGELRIGSGVLMPGASELTYKWRHLCCFTSRQITNMNSINNIEGFSDISECHQEVLRKMMRLELINDMSCIGKYISSSDDSKEATTKGKKDKKGPEDTSDISADKHSKSTVKHNTNVGVKRLRTAGTMGSAVTAEGVKVDTGIYSDATDDYDVEVTIEKPMCPYGSQCFRTSLRHFTDYGHPDGFEKPHCIDSAKEKDTLLPASPAVYVCVKAVRKCSSSSTRHENALLDKSSKEIQESHQTNKAVSNSMSINSGELSTEERNKSPVHSLSHQQYDENSIVEVKGQHTTDESALLIANQNRHLCPFGNMCVRKDAKHLADFLH